MHSKCIRIQKCKTHSLEYGVHYVFNIIKVVEKVLRYFLLDVTKRAYLSKVKLSIRLMQNVIDNSKLASREPEFFFLII